LWLRRLVAILGEMKVARIHGRWLGRVTIDFQDRCKPDERIVIRSRLQQPLTFSIKRHGSNLSSARINRPLTACSVSRLIHWSTVRAARSISLRYFTSDDSHPQLYIHLAWLRCQCSSFLAPVRLSKVVGLDPVKFDPAIIFSIQRKLFMLGHHRHGTFIEPSLASHPWQSLPCRWLAAANHQLQARPKCQPCSSPWLTDPRTVTWGFCPSSECPR
jgi:hypothetical protein